MHTVPNLVWLVHRGKAARMKRMKVDGDKICLLVYADDVIVISEMTEELQSLLDVMNRYGRDFGVKFSSEKLK